ncbi:NAD-P-binding protein [Ceratobasidium sp. AG-I]|nr:NAD-P-binding protein [Ceratobasidium sp. AG-I]
MGSWFSSAPTTNTDMTGRVILISGANRGIGFQTAKELYKLGGTIYLGARTEEKASEAIQRIRSEITESSGQLKWLPLDLSTIKKARDSAERFLKMEDKLDVLVCNAVLGFANFEINEDGIETMMAINHIGHFVLTSILLDLMKRTSTRPGSDVRVVVLTSALHTMARRLPVSFREPSDFSNRFPPDNPDSWLNTITRYGRSKLANILFMKELHRRLDTEGSGILTVSLHTGNVGTDSAYEVISKAPILGLLPNFLVKLIFTDEAEGARNSVFAAANPIVRAESDRYNGSYLMPVGKISEPSKLAQDEMLSKQLWSLTEKIIDTRKD